MSAQREPERDKEQPIEQHPASPFTTLLDCLALALARTLCFIAARLPYRVWCNFWQLLFRLAFLCGPKLRRTVDINLSIAFPELSPAERAQIAREHTYHLATVIADFFLMPHRSAEWIHAHIDCRESQAVLDAVKGNALIAAGAHFGSFEFFAHVAAVLLGNTSVVVREFTLPRTDAWWNSVRQAHGAEIMPRTGGFQGILQALDRRRTAGVLFDQNVRRQHAVFSSFFNMPAATTRAVGLAAVRTGAPVIVLVGKTIAPERYEVIARIVDTEDVRRNTTLSLNERVRIITDRTHAVLENVIREAPAQWFWLHRRWKTRPDGDDRRLYL